MGIATHSCSPEQGVERTSPAAGGTVSRPEEDTMVGSWTWHGSARPALSSPRRRIWPVLPAAPRRTGRGRLLWSGAGVTAVAALALWLVPAWLARGFHGADRVTAVGDARTACVAFVVAVGAGVTVFYTSKTYRLSREAQVTDRFTKAVSQLGEVGPGKLAVRLGGIFALERIAADSPRDLQPIADVLAAVVRETPADSRSRPDPGMGPEPAADVQAAAAVLGRLGQRRRLRIDLSWAPLAGVNLYGAYLDQANLAHADLRYADFSDARLARADLRYADLRGAKFHAADLRGAYLEGANPDEADLYQALRDP
jgi:hypothetical protein